MRERRKEWRAVAIESTAKEKRRMFTSHTNKTFDRIQNKSTKVAAMGVSVESRRGQRATMGMDCLDGEWRGTDERWTTVPVAGWDCL